MFEQFQGHAKLWAAVFVGSCLAVTSGCDVDVDADPDPDPVDVHVDPD